MPKDHTRPNRHPGRPATAAASRPCSAHRQNWCPVCLETHRSPRTVRRHIEGEGVPHYLAIYGRSQTDDVELDGDDLSYNPTVEDGPSDISEAGEDEETSREAMSAHPHSPENPLTPEEAHRRHSTSEFDETAPHQVPTHSTPLDEALPVDAGAPNLELVNSDDIDRDFGQDVMEEWCEGSWAGLEDREDLHADNVYAEVWGRRDDGTSRADASTLSDAESERAEDASDGGIDSEDALDVLSDSGGLYDCEIDGLTILQTEDVLNTQFRADALQNAQQLMESYMHDVRGFNLKVDTVMKDSVYVKVHRAFPNLPPSESIYRLRKTMTRLSGVEARSVDCCVSSCMCYSGPNEHLEYCLFCKEPRYTPQGQPVKTFDYVPLIPRLQGMYQNHDLSQHLQTYRSTYVTQPNKYSDIFDGELYQQLCNTPITDSAQGLQYYHFSNPHDIALGISFDGFCPFKRRKQTCWPIIAINYNLPPTERFKLVNIISLGVIPGPYQPKDTDSFLLPFVEEMLELTWGVKSFDGYLGEYFILRAFLIVAFGDIPAVAKMMRMKGHNGLHPCRCCNIEGIRNPSSSATTHYASLWRPGQNSSYDPLNLPLRTHKEFMDQAASVTHAETSREAEKLAKATGIKGIPLLSYLKTLQFPHSFPPDLMHAVFENVIPELLDLWTNSYKNIDDGAEDYCLGNTVIAAINEGISASGRTIPSSYGCRTPNFSTERYQFTAEAWSMWCLMLAPSLLRNRFKEVKYYKHFLELVVILNHLLALEISDRQVDALEQQIAKWVQSFEIIYLQKDLERLPVCTLPLHYLLHIAEGIRTCGPVWNYWAFAMEQYCGSLLPAVYSRKHPFKSLDRRILELGQLAQIKLIYNLVDTLDLRSARTIDDVGVKLEDYPDLVFAPPWLNLQFDMTLRRKAARTLFALFQRDVMHFPNNQTPTEQTILSSLSHSMPCCGKMKFLGGSMIHAHDLVNISGQGTRRDMSFVKFITANGTPSYGQLLRVFKIDMRWNGDQVFKEYMLAVIQPCKTTLRKGSIWQQHYTKGEFSASVVVDVTSVLELAARVMDPARGLGRHEEIFVEKPGALSLIDVDHLHAEHDLQQ